MPNYMLLLHELQRRKFSPVVELNRIVAIEQLNGAETALAALDELAEKHKLSHFNLFYITKAHLLEQTGDTAAAFSELRTALVHTSNRPVRRFIQRKIETIDAHVSKP